MSTPRRPLVTIDDPVTIIEPHRVLLEWVEEVRRDVFHTRAQEDRGYRHDQEGVVWARGHHLPDSEVVTALRAATSLNVPEETRKPGVSPQSSHHFQRLMEEAKKATDEAMRATLVVQTPWLRRWLKP